MKKRPGLDGFRRKETFRLFKPDVLKVSFGTNKPYSELQKAYFNGQNSKGVRANPHTGACAVAWLRGCYRSTRLFGT